MQRKPQKYMKRPYWKILSFFIIWRLALFVAAFIAVLLIPNFGARFPYYESLLITTGLPDWIWGFGNFDGVHYINIAKEGYWAANTQAFFPGYPLLIRYFKILDSFFITGIFLSNLMFLFSLFILYKLFRLDFDERVSLGSLLLLISFPTAYYFGSIYSESLFLFFCVTCIYLIRSGKFFWAGAFCALATATRILGIFLILLMVIEIIQNKNWNKKMILIKITSLFLAPLGIVVYMYYLFIYYHDPLYFLSVQPAFGAERSGNQVVLLPQVLFRYLKIFTTVNPVSVGFFNALLEFIMTIIPLSVILYLAKRVRLSYLIFTVGCLLLPTSTGTLSSMPRYALMSFLVFPVIVTCLKSKTKYLVIIFSILQMVLVSLFIRGYWVS